MLTNPRLLAMIGCGLGEALEPALQGFAITSTGSARNSLLFTTVAQCDTLAELIAGPLMATFLAIGRTASHPSNGFCFLASSVSRSLLAMSRVLLTHTLGDVFGSLRLVMHHMMELERVLESALV
jgi:hypothetical protein